MPRWVYFLLLAALVVGNVSIYREIFAPPTLTLQVLKSGKESAILVKSTGGKTFLINTGRDASILRNLGAALPFWERSLDGIILTSSAAGARGGLPDVESRYKVSSIIRSAYRGDRLDLGGGAYADILWPPTTPAPMSADMSELIILISYGTNSILIAPDPPPRAMEWVSGTDNLSSLDLTISSSTPTGTYLFK